MKVKFSLKSEELSFPPPHYNFAIVHWSDLQVFRLLHNQIFIQIDLSQSSDHHLVVQTKMVVTIAMRIWEEGCIICKIFRLEGAEGWHQWWSPPVLTPSQLLPPPPCHFIIRLPGLIWDQWKLWWMSERMRKLGTSWTVQLEPDSPFKSLKKK